MRNKKELEGRLDKGKRRRVGERVDKMDDGRSE